MRNVFILTIAMSLTLVAVPAFGQHPAEIGVDAGWTRFPGDVSDANGWRAGFRAGFYIRNWIELEGQMTGSRATDNIGSVELKTTLLTGLANGVFSLRKGKWDPYALIGIGVANLQVSPGISSFSDFALAWQIAGGTRFYVGKNMSLRGEVSHLREHTFDVWNGHWGITGGVSWTFGER
jgi:opacity protein-like surface antigen